MISFFDMRRFLRLLLSLFLFLGVCVSLKCVNPMQIAIVDDETEAIRSVKDPVLAFARQRGLPINVREFTDSDGFLSEFAPDMFDIVFLDIYIDEISGLDLARAIRGRDSGCMIIFVTTSRENMPEAFRFHAFDYIVKPVSSDRVIALLSDALAVLPTVNRYMTFTANRQEIKLFFSDCISASSSGHYLMIRSKSGEEYRTRMTVREFIEITESDDRFLMVNKGIIVNMDYIQSITERTCIMADGQYFPIKIRESQQIEQTWQNYCFDQIRRGQRHE